MRSTSRFYLFLFFLAGAVGAASGAVFELSNGDRLSGEIVARDDESITIQMTLGGAQVKLPRSALKSPPARPAKPTSKVAQKGTGPKPSAEHAATEKPAVAKEAPAPPPTGKPRPHRLREIPHRAYDEWVKFWEDNPIFRTLARVYPLMDWDNQINAGFSLNSGKSDNSNLDLLFRTEKRSGRHQTRFQVQFEFDQTTSAVGTDPDTGRTLYATKTTRDWWRGNARYRYDYAKAFFMQSDTNYQRRLEKSIYHEVDEMLGIGYRWLDTERTEGSVTPSAGFGFRDVAANDPEWNWLMSLQQDFRISLTDRVRITEESVFTYEPNLGTQTSDETGDFAFIFRAGLENQLNQRLSLKLHYEFNHDERIPAERGQSTHGIRFNLGAKF